MKHKTMVAVLVTWVIASQVALGQPGSAETMQKPIASPHATLVGVKECAACHSQPGILYPKLGVTQFVRLTEASQWFTNDKHALAYELIRIDLPEREWSLPKRASNRQSRDLVSKLGWTADDGNFERQCLTCHAGVDPQAGLDGVRASPNLVFGVHCESCHGPGSLYTDTANHQQPTWRTKSSNEKQELGMNDLANAAVCAEVCLSCHLGDIDRGRFVTHEMYAAGHPPLPPFELQTFLDAMPPHWGGLSNKPYRDSGSQSAVTFQYQEEYYRARLAFDATMTPQSMQHALESSYERTKRSRIGALTTQDVGMKLIQRAAEEPTLWGDYALYDCMGCHQTLTRDRPRFRSESRVPGRAFPPQWFSLNAVPEPTAAHGPYDAMLLQFEAAFNRVPFGNATQIRELALSSRPIFEERQRFHLSLGRKLQQVDETRGWLKELWAERRESLPNYWVARQTGWMVKIAIDELVRQGELQGSQVASASEELQRLLQLDLRTPQMQSLLVNQSSILRTANTFDSERCRELIEELVGLALPQGSR